MLIRKSAEADVAAISALVNDAAQAYRGVIPVDQWREPYISTGELEKEISSGVVFWVAEQDGRLLGVMGIQDKGDVALVRHARRPESPEGSPAPDILVDPCETDRNFGCPCRCTMDGGPKKRFNGRLTAGHEATS
jgi:hypothetical protein